VLGQADTYSGIISPTPPGPTRNAASPGHRTGPSGETAGVMNGHRRSAGPAQLMPPVSSRVSSQAENDGGGSGAILGARSAEQGCTSANGYGPSVAGPSVKERRNGLCRTRDRDLPIRRSDPDERGFPACCWSRTTDSGVRVDHGRRGRSQAAIVPRDSASSEIIALTYGLCDGGLDGHPPRCRASLG
jgi:hypothetical protein